MGFRPVKVVKDDGENTEETSTQIEDNEKNSKDVEEESVEGQGKNLMEPDMEIFLVSR